MSPNSRSHRSSRSKSPVSQGQHYVFLKLGGDLLRWVREVCFVVQFGEPLLSGRVSGSRTGGRGKTLIRRQAEAAPAGGVSKQANRPVTGARPGMERKP